ncbi:MAG: TolC family protein [Bryobacterales bacterium]|nr:TolC family protein [Bryobacterales bacterium]
MQPALTQRRIVPESPTRTVRNSIAATADAAVTSARRNKRLGYLMLVAMLASCAAASGQVAAPPPTSDTPVRIDLASVVQLVRDRNLQVKAGQEGVHAARERVGQATALRLGRIGVDSAYLRLNDPIAISAPPVELPILGGLSVSIPKLILAPQDQVRVRMEAGLPLFTGGKITNAVAQARAGEKAAHEAGEDIEAASIFEAERLYLGVLLGRDVLRLNESALQSYKRHLEEARIAYRLGVVANYDVIRAEAAVAEQEKRLTEARNTVDVTEAALRTILDLSDDTRLDIEGNLFLPPEPPPLTEAQSTAVESHPGLAALRHKVEALDRARRMETSGYLPQVTAVAAKETVTHKLAHTDPTWVAGVRATWSLFEGGSRRARISEKAAETARARIELRHAESQVRLAVRKSLLDYESQKSALDSARKTEELARESLRLAEKRFSVGTGASLEVLDANLTLTAAETGISNALYRMTLACLELHRHTGDIAEIALRIQK